MKLLPFRLFLAHLSFSLLPAAVSLAADDPATIAFSNPQAPGTIKINLARGELQIQGADTQEITVRTEARAVTGKPRADGLRVLSASSGYSLREKDNVVTLDATAHEGGVSGGDFKLTVPRDTCVVVQNAWGGDIRCSGLAGDIEINSMQGEIRLDDVRAGVVVSTMNGGIQATIRELRDGKPLSFTSMNGEVLLRAPVEAKASVRLRTQNGSVLTDFDESALVTKTETSSGLPRFARIVTTKSGTVIPNDVHDAIREAAHLSASAVKEAVEAVREGLESARRESDSARREMDRARSEADRVRSQAHGEHAAPPAPPAAPGTPRAAVAPRPPKVPIPTLSGGKLVTGTLNGGGPEISVSTMNGDVVLRKLEPKP